jgi:hypothetical protein
MSRRARGHLVSARFCVFANVVAIAVALGCRAGDSTANADARYEAALTGAQERPVQTPSNATGSAVVTVSGRTATYVVTANGFTTQLMAGHIHIGAEAVIGQVVVPFVIAAQSGMVATGTIDLGAPITYNTLTISGDSLRTLFETGRAYVNLHTAAWPDGEIRGQLIRR